MRLGVDDEIGQRPFDAVLVAQHRLERHAAVDVDLRRWRGAAAPGADRPPDRRERRIRASPAVVRRRVVLPEAFEQLFPAQYDPGVPGELEQEAELRSGEGEVGSLTTSYVSERAVTTTIGTSLNFRCFRQSANPSMSGRDRRVRPLRAAGRRAPELPRPWRPHRPCTPRPPVQGAGERQHPCYRNRQDAEPPRRHDAGTRLPVRPPMKG